MIEVTKASDISILSMYGELTLMEMEILEKTIESFKKSQHYKILLNLAGVDHVHFEVTKRLVGEAYKLREQDGDLRLTGVDQDTRNVFKFTGADQHIKDYSSISDAILSFIREARSDGPDAPTVEEMVADTPEMADLKRGKIFPKRDQLVH